MVGSITFLICRR